MIAHLVVVVTAVAALAACSTSPLPAGAECSQSPDCTSGLDCLDIAQVSGSACTVVGKICTRTCQGDGDCAALGSSFHCFGGCGSAMVCGDTTVP